MSKRYGCVRPTCVCTHVSVLIVQIKSTRKLDTLTLTPSDSRPYPGLVLGRHNSGSDPSPVPGVQDWTRSRPCSLPQLFSLSPPGQMYVFIRGYQPTRTGSGKLQSAVISLGYPMRYELSLVFDYSNCQHKLQSILLYAMKNDLILLSVTFAEKSQQWCT